MSITPLASVSLQFDYDVVAARRRARQIAALIHFDEQDQTRIATVTSEIARNALRYGGGGRVEFAIDHRTSPSLLITVSDRGPGIANLQEVLGGTYRSTTGMGIGIAGARRLMDDFDVRTAPESGTTVVMRKRFPPGAPELSKPAIIRLVDQLSQQRGENPIEEMQEQNAELLHALGLLNERQEQLERLNQELEDTNRGVLALYAELDEKADSLRRSDQVKTRFLSDMSHEFRTPVNSILALTRLLDDTVDTHDERKQVSLIRRAAEDLESLVNDLLDLAKIEAGKIDIRPAEFEVATLFSAVRGMLRPLLLNRSLTLVFEEPEVLVMYTDEGKVSQILRNFVSNALKYTEAGEVRVTAQMTQGGTSVRFSVADTGIGIAPEDQERIFEEFAQIDNPLQTRTKGTGLGLPLTRKLALLLGGSAGVTSELGVGSTFWAEIPVRYASLDEILTPPAATFEETSSLRILVIDDDETARYAISSFAARPGTSIVEAENGLVGINRAQSDHPDVILLDLMMPGIGGHEVLQRLKSDANTASIPVIVITSRFVNDAERRQILSKAVTVIYKGDLSRETVTRAIDDAVSK